MPRWPRDLVDDGGLTSNVSTCCKQRRLERNVVSLASGISWTVDTAIQCIKRLEFEFRVVDQFLNLAVFLTITACVMLLADQTTLN